MIEKMFGPIWESMLNYELSRLVTVVIVVVLFRVFMIEHLRVIFKMNKSKEKIGEKINSLSLKVNSLKEKIERRG